MSQWYVHEESGRVFASIPSKSHVVEYNRKGEIVRTFELPNTPQRMISKNNQLVVAMGASARDQRKRGSDFYASVVRIPLDTNQVSKELKLTGRAATGLFCSRADNAYVGGATLDDSSHLYQVDLDQWEVRHMKELNRQLTSEPVNITMSHDGKWIVLDGAGMYSPSGADLFAINESSFEIELFTDIHHTFGSISAGPASRFWMFGDKAFLPFYEDEDSHWKDFKMRNSGGRIHPTKDLVAVSDENQVAFHGLVSDKKYGAFPLKLEKKEISRSRRRSEWGKRTQLYFDRLGNLYHFRDNTCQLTSLKALEIDAPSPLLMELPSYLKLELGESIDLPIKFVHGETNVNVQATSAPDGLEIDNGRIRFRPTSQQLGEHTIEITATHNDRTDKIKIQLDVSAKETKLGIAVQKFKLSHDGKRALCWGPKITDQQANQRAAYDRSDRDIVVVDLEQSKVLARKHLPNGFTDAAISNQHVFVAPTGTNTVIRLDRDTLASPKIKNLTHQPNQLFATPADQLLIYQLSSFDGKLALLDSESMDLIDQFIKPSNSEKFYSYQSDRFSISGRTYDSQTGALISTSSGGGLPCAINTQRQRSINEFQSTNSHRYYSHSAWGRKVTDQNVANSRGDQVFNILNTRSNRRGVTLSQNSPMLFQLSDTEGGTHEARKRFVNVRFVSLLDGEAIGDWNVQTKRGRNFNNSYHHDRDHIKASKNHIVIAQHDSILVIPAPGKTPFGKTLTPPLHITHPSKSIVAADQPQSLQIETLGGKSKLQFALRTEYPEIEIDASTGIVTVDAPKLWKNYLRGRSGSQPSRNIKSFQNSHSSQGNQVPIKTAYRRLTGKELEEQQEAITFPVHVAVSDSDGQIDEALFYILIRGSVAEHNKELAKMQERREASRRHAKRVQDASNQVERVMQSFAEAWNKAGEGVEKPRRDIPADKEKPSATKNDRLDQLERRVRRMEATADAILRKLEELDKKQQSKKR